MRLNKKKDFINKHDNSIVKVLKNIDISIKYNEFVCIVGPSGCGKTTLMNIIGGLIESDEQKILLNKKKLQVDKILDMFFKLQDSFLG